MVVTSEALWLFGTMAFQSIKPNGSRQFRDVLFASFIRLQRLCPIRRHTRHCILLGFHMFLTGAISFRKCVTHLVVFTIYYHPRVTLNLPPGSEMLPHILDLVAEPAVTDRLSTMPC